MKKKLITIVIVVAIFFTQLNFALAAPSTNYTLTGNQAEDVVAVAVAQDGLNRKEMGFSDEWCAFFVCWAGRTAKADFPKTNLANAKLIARWFVNNDAGVFYCFRDGNYTNLMDSGITKPENIVQTTRENFTPQKGDLICYLWTADVGRYNWSHIGIVRENYTGNGIIKTVEGNTSENGKAYTENGHVELKDQPYDSQVIGIIRPNYINNSIQASFDTDRLTLNPGETKTVKVTFSGNGIQYFSCESINEDICSVTLQNIDWKTGVANLNIKALAPGVTQVYVYLKDNNKNVLLSKSIDTAVNEYNPILSLSETTVFLDLLNKPSQQITIQIGGVFPKSKLSCTSSDISMVSGAWGDRLSETSVSFIIYGYQRGTATLTFSLKDANRDKVLVTEAITVIVSAPTFSVNFDANGGSVSPSSITVTYSDTYGWLPVPVRDGYTFDGWFTDPTSGTQVTEGTTVDITSDQTLYAHWTQNALGSGTCGDNLIWVLSLDGVLTISGTGTMYDYEYGASPWHDSRSQIISVVLENGVTHIGRSAFYGCMNLTNVAISDSVISIGDSAFEHCDNLTNITIPDSVTSIGNYVFNWCKNLVNIYVSAENSNYSSVGGILFNKDATILIRYPAGNFCDAYVIPDSVTIIDACAFNDCTKLTSVTIPDSVIEIRAHAFEDCNSLTKIYYEGNSTQWNSICIVDSGNYALKNANIIFAEVSPTIIASGQCGDNLTWTLDEGGVLTISGTGDMWDWAFWDYSSIVSVEILDGVTSIGNQAFLGCNNLASITIPDSVTTVGVSAFFSCTSLTHVEIPDGVTNISDSTFLGCTNLINIQIPNSVISIGEYAFLSCTNLTNIEIPDGVTTIGDYAFEDCHNLTDVQIPSSVTCIGSHSFGGTDVLENIVVGTYLAQATGTGNEFIVYGLPFSVTISNETFTTGEFWLVSCQNGAIYPYGYAKPTTIVGKQTKTWWNAAKHTINGVDYKDSINYVLDDAGYDKEHAYTWFFDADGYVIGSSSNLFAHTHIEEVIPGYSATCTENGLTDGLWCVECGEILLAQEVIPAMGHIDDNSDDLCDRCSKNLCTPKIVFANQSVTSGQTITVEITAVNMPAVKSLMLENFQYDRDMLEFVDAELNLENAVIADWDSATMIATVAFGENTDINGTILTLTFKVKDGVEGECSMTCDVYVNQMQADGNETQVELSVVSGIITVISYQRGDVNGDGYVNSNDSIYLLRYTLSPNRYPINQSGDMNGDGYVNSNDAIYLLRHTLTPNRYPLY